MRRQQLTWLSRPPILASSMEGSSGQAFVIFYLYLPRLRQVFRLDDSRVRVARSTRRSKQVRRNPSLLHFQRVGCIVRALDWRIDEPTSQQAEVFSEGPISVTKRVFTARPTVFR